LYPDKVEKGKYNKDGLGIMTYCKQNSIPLIKDLAYMNISHYRNGIHLSERG
jgi:hypothetical protein